MIEPHYAKFIVDAMDEFAAKAVIPLSPATVTPLKAVDNEWHGRRYEI